LSELAAFHDNRSLHINSGTRFYLENGAERDAIEDKNGFLYRFQGLTQMARKVRWTLIDLRPLLERPLRDHDFGFQPSFAGNRKTRHAHRHYQSRRIMETETPVKPESVFIIASLGKQFVATAILLLQKDGKLALDDKVSKYLDGFPDSWKDITFRQLLNHTSGIVRDPADYQPYKKQPVTEVIQAMYSVPLNAKPGEKWLYSNVGYYILAEAITKISGKPWDKFIAERLFVPAGMTATRTTSAADIIPDRVSGCHHTAEGRINAENWIAVRPSGSFLSGVRDLAKWDAYLDKGDLLSESDRKLLWTRGTLTGNTPVNYGFGWYLDS
jgi:CubicO group peptidase (beta-lactamase class C family)